MTVNRSTFFLPQERFDEVKKKYPHFNEPWSKEDLEKLTEMAIQNSSQKEMAQELGRTAKSVRLKLMEKGLYKIRQTKNLDNKDYWIDHMYREGLTIPDIAHYVILSEHDVMIRILRLDIAKRTIPDFCEDITGEPGDENSADLDDPCDFA